MNTVKLTMLEDLGIDTKKVTFNVPTEWLKKYVEKKFSHVDEEERNVVYRVIARNCAAHETVNKEVFSQAKYDCVVSRIDVYINDELYEPKTQPKLVSESKDIENCANLATENGLDVDVLEGNLQDNYIIHNNGVIEVEGIKPKYIIAMESARGDWSSWHKVYLTDDDIEYSYFSTFFNDYYNLIEE